MLFPEKNAMISQSQYILSIFQWYPIISHDFPDDSHGFPGDESQPGFAVARGKRLGTLRVASTAGCRLTEAFSRGGYTWGVKHQQHHPKFIKHGKLVGGLEHFFDFPTLLGIIIPTDFRIFSEGFKPSTSNFTFVKTDFSDCFNRDGEYEESDVIGV